MKRENPSKSLYHSLIMGLAAGVVLGLAFIGGYLYRDRFVELPRSDTSFDLLSEADSLLATYFFGDLPGEEARVHGAVGGLVTSLNDPYTVFVEPEKHEVDSTNLAGRFGGIGAEIGRDEEGRFVLVTVYRDGPGYAAGLRDGDILLAVDGKAVDTSTPDSNELVADIRGPVGKPVLLTVLRGEETLDIEVIRAEITIPSVEWRLLEEDERTGYIRISRFTDRAPEELNSALDELTSQGATAFVLDLRSNGGGLVDSAVRVASEFLSGGVVLREERRNSGPRTFNATLGGAALDQPVVVLIDGATASASEIVAGALQDRERALLIGESTFGKGSVQLIMELSNGSSLHITSARWHTPNNRPIDGQGLTPDIVAEPGEGQDAELAAAIDYLGQTLTVAEADLVGE